ncbi:MAG: hypothetical protein MZV64_58710 [Ignavibacteriales bacterium]|nr:hypothetical protein [Ignavibacteriales bacterium]
MHAVRHRHNEQERCRSPPRRECPTVPGQARPCFGRGVELGMKPQRSTSARFICVRAPMIKRADDQPTRIKRVHRQGGETREHPHQHLKVETAL